MKIWEAGFYLVEVIHTGLVFCNKGLVIIALIATCIMTAEKHVQKIRSLPCLIPHDIYLSLFVPNAQRFVHGSSFSQRFGWRAHLIIHTTSFVDCRGWNRFEENKTYTATTNEVGICCHHWMWPICVSVNVSISDLALWWSNLAMENTISHR